jgi:hypothetical protein
MSRRTLEADDEIEAAAMEQARAMVRELRQLADATPDGHVLARVENLTVELGRRFVRDRLQDVLNAQAADLEKKGGADGPAPAAGRDAIAAGPPAGSSPPPARWPCPASTSPAAAAASTPTPSTTAWGSPASSARRPSG